MRPVAWYLKTAPTTEPLSSTEAKLHLRVDASDEDTLITALITAARQHVENIAGRALISQTWVALFEEWPKDHFELPMATPLVSVSSVKYTPDGGVETTLSSSVYYANTVAYVGNVSLADDQAWPTDTLRTQNPISVEYVCGNANAAAVPSAIKAAMLLHIGHLFENREAVNIGNTVNELPLAYEALIAPYRVRTL
jgi:uncharacterized phiE125 gp8 family phage protein